MLCDIVINSYLDLVCVLVALLYFEASHAKKDKREIHGMNLLTNTKTKSQSKSQSNQGNPSGAKTEERTHNCREERGRLQFGLLNGEVDDL
ncbi:hypothetical protein MPTK1_6g15520 [Marchantia polymorpha subsp. ruderalis]|uniref:Uncharacterized protein n=2 Tax=Marchantia polymorpha TaxID=3197 RepID=A0AAF6BSD4_MARPO|nr:hypothetical protein MARPO_0056s0064 [Marchantia polymorpha]BBN14918.1 hypothetical protein Mp_6g15520 [Marchantia polymorpha subsp. ruderalis]|eukprot:PTQ37602.1 hypothetical protein MARPO_0056s0064 [Marchantia polymorpha]